MGLWIIAALVGAVPLYFAFNYAKTRSGKPLWTTIGFCMSATIMAWLAATSVSDSAITLAAVVIAWLGAVATCGALAGALAGAITRKDQP